MRGKKNTGSKKVTLGLLIVYLAVLTWIILFKMELDIEALRKINLRSMNLIPFAGSVIVNGKVELSEIIPADKRQCLAKTSAFLERFCPYLQ